MADRGRGGNQPPRNPAAVSNPGSGRRTDGGAGSKSQPIRVPTGGKYGEAKALKAQQQGAPLDAGGSAPPSPTGSPQGGPPAGVGGEAGGAFGPTQRPNEDPAMMPNVNNPVAQNPQAALRVMYAKFPHPAIKRLLDLSAYGSRPPR